MTSSSQVSLNKAVPTVFLRTGAGGALDQRITVSVDNPGAPVDLTVVASAEGREVATPLGTVPSGKSEHDAYVPEIRRHGQIMVSLRAAGKIAAQCAIPWRSPKRWTVHLVHVSHHDAGYTDLFANVLREHDQFLDSILDMADSTRDFPDDAQFRLVVEQAWSIHHFLHHAPADKVARMESLLKSGHVEVTALFGNMTTHVCGHETLLRTLYPAFELRRKLGIPIVSAEHNDVPGVSWGVAEALIAAGVRIFLPDFPHYWDWGNFGLQGFWDEAGLFGKAGVPGPIWWEAPSGRRLLLWASNECTAKTFRPWLPQLAPRLQELADQDWPYDVFRCQCRGGQRDNAPYTVEYARTARQWNADWAYPHLICSTNARFYEDILRQLPANLPVVRGDLPDQDYPVGAVSTARATAVNRSNHIQAPAAECLASMAALTTDLRYPAQRLAETWQEGLWHDEHTWGTGGPRFGPAAETSELEKALHAHRAMTLAHDVARKAAARIADHVAVEGDDYHLVVFNSLAHPRSAGVATPLWEMENCGSEIVPVVEAPGHLIRRSVNLTDRNSMHLPDAMMDGQFDLIDVTTGRLVPFQVDRVSAPDEPVPYGARRYGTAQGGKRLGLFDVPTTVARTLRFLAQDVPACGYRTYRLRSRSDTPQFAGAPKASSTAIENEYFRVTVDPKRGRIVGIFDKKARRELLDAQAPHSLGELVVRDPTNELAAGLENVQVSAGHSGSVSASIVIRGSIAGHPQVCQSVSLTAGVRRVELATYILKDPTPLLDVHMAFPFLLDAAQFRERGFRFEGPLSVMRPILDSMPGTFSDALAVQNWVKAADASLSVLWSSLDAPVAGLGGLWPGRLSPAHRAVITDRLRHPPLKPEDITRPWIYCNLFSNNFCTNFSINQCGEFLFRHVIATADGDVGNAEAAAFGWDAMTPPEAVLTQGSRSRPLAPAGSMLEIDNPAVMLLAWKRAEDEQGWILRFWNVSDAPALATVKLPHLTIAAVQAVSAAEEELGGGISFSAHEFKLELPSQATAGVRLLMK